MNVICLQDEALYELIDKVVERIQVQKQVTEDRWISSEEAMHMLRITSKTTLAKFRSEGSIRFSHPEKKIILYDSISIQEFIEKNANETF